MKIILHIGMGKTGTSTIQKTLAQNSFELRQAGMMYLGMWFDLVDPSFKGLRNQAKFFSLEEPALIEAAEVLFQQLSETAKTKRIHTFVISNESFAGKSAVLEPMIRRLIALGMEVEAIGYVRNPHDWLPSAYVQWGVRHKMSPGPIPPYAEKARGLVNWYSGIVEWHKRMSDILHIRSYEAAPDVVADFGAAIGVKLTPLGARVLERGEEAEIVLRAIFNDGIAQGVLPDVFDKAVLPGLKDVPKVEDLLVRLFDYSDTAAIVAARADLFDALTEACGFDPRVSGKVRVSAIPEAPAVRDRLVDALLEVVLSQAQRIKRIETALERVAAGEPLEFAPVVKARRPARPNKPAA
ncbi:hypothetical protein [Stagnihabitans tardus]|uniref:Sulfotransferase domain-containing protein n=1 Tax=Stagnihabitans tardus TaxID=2699202 RepID=A0AAE4YE57_9RHOB|nr:hypothetical protein [Stagnihabitans tardus]NBZ88005.1 hypothetical protein [Stagnihabitans tardus]